MKNRSFTLIELLVVIVIIGILAGVIVISTSSAIDKASIAKLKVFEESIQNELGANMVSRWKLDGDTKDAWGNNHGDVVGSIEFKKESDCVLGDCVYFSGSVGNYIKVTSSPSLKNIDEITLSFWFKSYTTGGSQGPVSKMYGTKPYWSIWLNSSRRYIWEIADATSAYYKLCGNYNFNYDQWYYAVVTQKGENYTVYSNSLIIMQNNDVANFTETKSDSDLLIGALNLTNYPFKGYIDDVRIYNAALSSSQIKQNYIAGLNSMLSNGNISKQEYNERISRLAQNE